MSDSQQGKEELSPLKRKTAGSLKWNTIDRVLSQLLYAVTGIILANILDKEDFGLVGALLVFQAFAILFVDSGFGAALLQKKNPEPRDYSTVFWFNLAVSLVIYVILWFAAPGIADIFQGDQRLIPLSRVMFVTFIFSGMSIVQSNMLMKRMDVKKLAIADTVALILSGALGVVLALTGFGAWALVWQSVALAAIKSLYLWLTIDWLPTAGFHLDVLKSILPVGTGSFVTAFLNTVCLNIYSLIIGAFYSLASLGVYTQADKWSKMGSASITQILASSFVPLLARFQDEPETYRRYITRINRFTGMILFPILLGITAIGAPMFHVMFGTKWDAAIPLFQILTTRGIFVVLITLYSNYLLSIGKARRMVAIEIVKDLMIMAAIFATVFLDNIEALVWGQFGASVATYFIVLAITCTTTGYGKRKMLKDLLPFFAMGSAMFLISYAVGNIFSNAWISLSAAIVAGVVSYCLMLRLFCIPEFNEFREFITKKR